MLQEALGARVSDVPGFNSPALWTPQTLVKSTTLGLTGPMRGHHMVTGNMNQSQVCAF